MFSSRFKAIHIAQSELYNKRLPVLNEQHKPDHSYPTHQNSVCLCGKWEPFKSLMSPLPATMTLLPSSVQFIDPVNRKDWPSTLPYCGRQNGVLKIRASQIRSSHFIMWGRNQEWRKGSSGPMVLVLVTQCTRHVQIPAEVMLQPPRRVSIESTGLSKLRKFAGRHLHSTGFRFAFR